MATIKKCPHCGQRIRNKMHSYSSGSGCLTLVWRDGTREATALSRKVTRADAERYLNSKENEHLVQRNWLPVFIGGKWVLARHVKRTGPDRLRIGGHSYHYTLKDHILRVTFKMRIDGKTIEREMPNESLRMVIRYFLEHEQELKPQLRITRSSSGRSDEPTRLHPLRTRQEGHFRTGMQDASR